jgi:hypothetical protein
VPNLTVTGYLQAFLIFSILVITLGMFQKTHMLAVWIMGLAALSITIKWANGGFTQNKAAAATAQPGSTG